MRRSVVGVHRAMAHAFRIVNVFTVDGDRFSGNPLCVFEDARGLTEAQMQALRLAGCSHLQGYYLSRPVPEEAAFKLALKGSLTGEDETVEEVGTGTNG